LTYLVKYQTFLADADPVVAMNLFGEAVPGPKSDGVGGVEHLIGRVEPIEALDRDHRALLVNRFNDLYEAVTGGSTAVHKSDLAADMSRLSLSILLSRLKGSPSGSDLFDA
jgi:hypothetical protein